MLHHPLRSLARKASAQIVSTPNETALASPAPLCVDFLLVIS
jgi:hypothetical protein